MLTASKGTISYGEEEGPEVLFLLRSGKVKLERVSPAGQKLTLAIVERVSFFGEMSLLGQSLVGTQAVAIEDAVICAMSCHDLPIIDA
jgi:CRP/FNR family transcriptional regulator